MIRYVPDQPLEDLVEAEAPGWLQRAHDRTEALRAAGQYVEASSIWSEVKPVYIRLQRRKCIFCERPLASEEIGAIEHDVEHFRPKSEVKRWTPPLGIASAYGPADPDGYYWLAYDLHNYATACKPCNTIKKGSFFPIAAAVRGQAPDDVPTLNGFEQPMLLFPLGDLDVDPEDAIAFEGTIALPKQPAGPLHDRALVTIAFFDLNLREDLQEDRFRAIREVWMAYSWAQGATSDEQREAAQRALIRLAVDSQPHASCTRSYLRLIETNPTKAWQIYKNAEAAVGARDA